MAASPRLTRAESRARTRRALLEAAGALFVERGLQATSIEAIAERAGFTRGAFYANFESKEQAFAELLQARVYSAYRRMAEEALAPEGEIPGARATGERLARVQAHPAGGWLFRLWLELLAQAGRDERLRALAAGFWRDNRLLVAAVVERAARELGVDPPLPPERMATALIAMDIGLAIQHHVDPDAVPLEAYPEVFAALFEPPPAG